MGMTGNLQHRSDEDYVVAYVINTSKLIILLMMVRNGAVS
jgi:hypothetical protein